MRDKKNRLRVAIYMRVAQKEQCEEAVTARPYAPASCI